MSWFGNKRQVFKVSLQGRDLSVDVQPGETLLQAMLGRGICFPYLCRVGSCGTCKSRLTGGSIKSLVDLSYVLTADEMRKGYILPCQAIATSDCELFNLSAGARQESELDIPPEWLDSDAS